jgi:NADH-quinone oxidoreductase subunit J
MNSITALFYVFSAVLLFAGLRVITARSTVHAALYLVLAFFSASCLWMLLRAEFLAIALVLVYVGAVMVLFLFVVMMLDINSDAFRDGFYKHLPVAGFVGALIALQMALVLMRGFQGGAPAPTAREIEIGNTRLLGIEIYTDYLYPLQLAAVLLLVAIIAANKSRPRRPTACAWSRSRRRSSSLQHPMLRPGRKEARHDGHTGRPHAGPLPQPRRHPVRAVGGGHIPESPQPDRAADGH